MTSNAQLINQTSGEYEYRTPTPIILAAKEVLGSGMILDPASAGWANQFNRMDRYYTKEQDGLSMEWRCDNLWMNHPFGRKENPLWISKLIEEFDKGNAKQAMCITYACTSEAWFKPLFRFPMCFLRPRTNYYLQNGTEKKGVTKGSVVTFLTNSTLRIMWFAEVFSELGEVVGPILQKGENK